MILRKLYFIAATRFKTLECVVDPLGAAGTAGFTFPSVSDVTCAVL